MAPVPNPVTRALLGKLLVHANGGISRAGFFENVSETLLEATNCDTIELLVAEPLHTYRCVTNRRGDGSFHFERLRTSGGDARLPELRSLAPDCAALRCEETDYGSVFCGGTGGGPALALIPLVVGLERIGILRLESASSVVHALADRDRYEQMADALAVALDYHRAQWALRERVKELSCLYSISQVAEQHQLPLPEVLRRVAGLLPPGWQYPGICSACIELDGASYPADGPAARVHTLSSDIMIGQQRRGAVHVSYSESRPELDEGPFLREERSLVNEVARLVTRIVRRRIGDEERLRLQDQLRHADRLATIGQLAARVAHELNEPLGAVLGFAQLTRKSPRLPRQSAQDLDRIIRAALHAREVVKKLLVFVRPTPPQKAQVDLNELVQAALEIVRPRCDSDGADVINVLASDLPSITADPTQIHQLIVNLVVNAVQAVRPSGNVTVRTSAGPEFVTLSVEDTGPGMSEEVLRHIFLPFFTTKEAGQGTGLGLCVVHSIVTSHGGTIQVHTRSGKGTRFEVHLPLSSPSP
jgi:two-component system NtrC family sensor kinase